MSYYVRTRRSLVYEIPPALWATGGLKAFLPQNPSSQNPFTGVLPPPRARWTGGLRVVWDSFGIPRPFRKRSKNHSLFCLIFATIMVPLWFQKELPKAARNFTKSASGWRHRSVLAPYSVLGLSLVILFGFSSSWVHKGDLPGCFGGAPPGIENSNFCSHFLLRFLD